MRRNETLSDIIEKTGASEDDLRAANADADLDDLQEGQVICVPGVLDDICPEGRLYTVRRDDTMERIADRYRTTPAVLADANPQVPDPDVIYRGEELCIPPRRTRERSCCGGESDASVSSAEEADVTAEATAAPRHDCPGGILYAARRGETVRVLARRFGLAERDIERANPGIDPDRLQIGQILCIPEVADEICPEGRLYTVRRGDTMFRIARRYSVPLSRLMEANPHIPDPDLIYPGEQLCIPPREKPPVPRCPGGLLYAVRRGETLSSIARKFGVRVRAIERANPDIDPDRLQIGQILCIPEVADEICPEGRLYTVRPTDSFFTIARRYSVSVDHLVRVNHWIPDPAVIYPGEQICIPPR